MRPLLSLVAVSGITLGFSLWSCAKNPMSGTTGNLKLSIKAVPAPAKVAAGVQQVTITAAQIVIGEIEIESSERDSMDFMSSGPLVVNLDVTGSRTTLGAIAVPFGRYDEIEVAIAPLQASAGQVYTANPDLQNRSLLVRGYIDGDSASAFVFASAIRLEQEQELSPPLLVDANSPNANIVLALDTASWFRDSSGGYLDPRLPRNQKAIEHNIKNSLKAFADDDDEDGDD